MSKEITLAKAGLSNCEELYQLQTISFRQHLEKYQDYDSNPGAETKDRTLQRLKDPFTDYYFICLSGKHIGAVRISHFETLCRLKQLFILPEFQGHGYAQQAILLAEALYPEIQRWELDTISQEAKMCIRDSLYSQGTDLPRFKQLWKHFLHDKSLLFLFYCF